MFNQEKEWHARYGVWEEGKLELRLGPPGEVQGMNKSVFNSQKSNGAKRGFVDQLERCCGGTNASDSQHIVVSNSSQKRIAVAPVVGWPPIRSFRKNLTAVITQKANSNSPNEISKKKSNENGKSESLGNGLFIKINMDGVPIGRKVDLNAYESYENLSVAVDQLFRDLLAAQMETISGKGNTMEMKAITGLLDGSGEYTLVYEDYEGDRMLVGDVPWNMFVSTVKRLRVLKSSEISTLCFSSDDQDKPPLVSEVDLHR